jgi:23S rRNA (uracil1939-C5)-methyltransferase
MVRKGVSVAFELTPQKLIYGGDALGYHQGRTVLVPLALPGERVKVEPVRTAKGVVHARLLEVLAPALERVDPACPYFGRCGGCQYQHLSQEFQTTSKREILRESLRRIGKIVWDSEIVLHSAHPWNYRNQAQLKVARGPEGQVALGFFEAESHRLFPVDTCLILSPRLNTLLAELRHAEWSQRLGDCQEIELLADDRDECVRITLRGELNPGAAAAFAQECLEKLPGVVSVAIERGRKFQVFAEPTLAYSVGEIRYRVSPGSFFQASRFLLAELVAAVTGGAAGELALDLFAGVGLFTLPLARRFNRVAGVEANPPSVADLKSNAESHGIENLRAVGATTFDFLRRFAQTAPDLVVLDPPRGGVDAGSLKLLAALRPRQIHYVSCSPPTLARDLRLLIAPGYQLNSIEFFDFFPQTSHIEALARLIRKDLAR